MSERNPSAGDQPWATLVKCYREDAGFRDRLATNPAAALAETGLELPAGVDQVSVAENTAATFHVIFPPSPNARLHDEALGAVAGGSGGDHGGGRDTPASDYYRRHNTGYCWG